MSHFLHAVDVFEQWCEGKSQKYEDQREEDQEDEYSYRIGRQLLGSRESHLLQLDEAWTEIRDHQVYQY